MTNTPWYAPRHTADSFIYSTVYLFRESLSPSAYGGFGAVYGVAEMVRAPVFDTSGRTLSM